MNFAVPTLCMLKQNKRSSKHVVYQANKKDKKNQPKVQCLHTKLDKQQEQLLFVHFGLFVCLFVCMYDSVCLHLLPHSFHANKQRKRIQTQRFIHLFSSQFRFLPFTLLTLSLSFIYSVKNDRSIDKSNRNQNSSIIITVQLQIEKIDTIPYDLGLVFQWTVYKHTMCTVYPASDFRVYVCSVCHEIISARHPKRKINVDATR